MSEFLETKFEAPKPSMTPWKSVCVAMDIGSTQTRSAVYDTDANIDEEILLDSNYEVYVRDLSHVESPSDTLSANLDLIITDETAESKVKPFITCEHVIKGDLLAAVTTNSQITGASVSKVDQKVTYINVVTNVAIQLLQQFSKRGMPDGTISVSMTVALPPEDTKHQEKMNVFRSSLAGTYTVEFVRLGVTVKFTILEDMKIVAEPEAAAVYLSVNNALEDEDDAVVCVLDIGGRSTGITFISDKHLLVDSCTTVNIGGSKLAAIFSRELAAAYNIQEPLIPRVMKSMKTGTMKIGARKLDVSDQLNSAKSEFASLIMNELIRSVDINEFQLQNISTVYCSGRTFGAAPKSPSLMTFIEKLYTEKSAYTAFKPVEATNPILSGLCYKGILSAQN